MNLESIQKEVTQLYYNHLKDYQGGLNLSRPHVPLISEAYLKNRIIILGQETNTWYHQGEDDLLNFYIKNYDSKNPLSGTEPYKQFISESVLAYPGKFWEFAKNLYDNGIVEGPIQKDGFLGHCWLNLFSVEAIPSKNCSSELLKKGRPTSNRNLAEAVINVQSDLLFQLAKILKPKTIIALTGQSLDHILFNRSLNLSWENEMSWTPIDPKGIFREHEMAEVKVLVPDHPLHGVKVIRSYHPSYFKGRINGNKRLKRKIEDSGFEQSVSSYYQSVLFDWLSKYN